MAYVSTNWVLSHLFLFKKTFGPKHALLQKSTLIIKRKYERDRDREREHNTRVYDLHMAVIEFSFHPL